MSIRYRSQVICHIEHWSGKGRENMWMDLFYSAAE